MSSHNPTDIEGQAKRSQDEATRLRQAEQLETNDVKWLMSQPQGRRIVKRTLERAGVHRLSFNTNSMQMAFNEGMRNEGLRLTATLMAACPELYTTMLKEKNE